VNTTPFLGRSIHLMGIGGAGVGALVPLLRAVGATISGCDAHSSPAIERFRRQGIAIDIGHDQAHVEGVDILVHTAAVGPDHAEIAAARRLGVVVMTRAQCLVQLMQGTRTIAVAGSHGKSSTTWMLGHLLVQAGLDPVVMVGGGVAALGEGGARVGAGNCFVAETDESDGSFASVDPEVAIVTNLDHEHLRHYGSFDALLAAFRGWLMKIPAHGLAILPVSGAAATLAAGLRCRVLHCGLDTGEVHAENLELGGEGSFLHVNMAGIDIGLMPVPLPGVHMALNALMAITAARWLAPDCDPGTLAGCDRVARRFTVHGVAQGVRVVEDYGHHPTEIRATIAAARLAGGRVHVLFQPHRYSRTIDCFGDFATAFDQAAAVVVAPIYAASEAPIAGVSAAALVAAIAERRTLAGEVQPVVAVAEAAAGIATLVAAARSGDTCLVLGAGDIGRLAPALLRALTAPGGEAGAPVVMAARGDSTW